MKIDDAVEPLVRQVLDAAVKDDDDRMAAALRAFPDDDARRKGLELAVAIGYVALMDAHDGNPSPEELKHTAAALAEMGAWAGVTENDARTYLTALPQGTLAEKFDPDTAVKLVFVNTANLLAGSPKAEGQPWWQYMDRVLATIAKG